MLRLLTSTSAALLIATGAIAQSDGSSSEQSEMQSGQSMSGDSIFANVPSDPSLQLGSQLIGTAIYSTLQTQGGSDQSSGEDMSSTSSDSQSSGSGSGSDSQSASSSQQQQQPEQIGEVNDIIVTQDGQVEYAIVGVGGFLGIGERDVALQMSALTFEPDPNNEGEFMVMVDATQEEIENAPEFDSSTIQGGDQSGGSEQSGNMEQSGNNMENAAENTGQAAEQAGDAAEQAGENAEQATTGN